LRGSMGKTICIAQNTVREAFRDKVMYSLAFFGGLVLVLNRVLTPLALGEGSKITRDVGLSCISLFGLFIIVLSGTTLIHRELDKKTIAVILSKPVSRGQFIVGRFFGLFATIAAIAVCMALLLQAVLLVTDGAADVKVMVVSLVTVFELMVMTSVAVFFSAAVSPILAAMITVAAYVVGSFSGDLIRLADLAEGSAMKAAARALYYLLPNLEMFNLRAAAVHNLAIEPSRVAAGVLYAIAYSAAMVLLAVVVFRRREIP
jgi:ABC-type transport system involved in multi-copper enzyme maturation permease subunit